MNRIEINVQTGERQIIPLTQAELDAAAIRGTAELAYKASLPPTFEERLRRIEQWARTMGFTG